MTPDLLLECADALLDIEEPNGNWPAASNDTLIVAAPSLIRALLARVREAEQERDELAERVIAFCARIDGHMDESQQRHPTWRGVTTS